MESITARSEVQFRLVDVWRFTRRNLYLIVVTTVLGGATSVAIAFTLTPIFRAEVVAYQLPDDATAGSTIVNQIAGLASLAGADVVGSSSRAAEREATLRSRMLAETFIEENGLLPILYSADSSNQTLWFGVRKFRGEVLNIEKDLASGLFTISVEWTDPIEAARWANEYMILANEVIRERDVSLAQRNIEFLNEQIEKTTVVELQSVLFGLLENETKTLMLAGSRDDFAFTIVDPAVPPELRVRPARVVIVTLGVFFGAVIGALIALVRKMIRDETQASSGSLASN